MQVKHLLQQRACPPPPTRNTTLQFVGCIVCVCVCVCVCFSINYSEFAFNNVLSFKSMYLSEYIIFIIIGQNYFYCTNAVLSLLKMAQVHMTYTQQIPKLCTSLLCPSILRHCTTETKGATINT